MFITQGFKPKDNNFWKYIVGSLIVFMASIVGQIPLVLAIFAKTLQDGTQFPTDESELMTILDSNLTLFLMLISFLFALLALYFTVKYFHKQHFVEVTTAREKVDWKRIFFSFGLWSIITIVTVLAGYFLSPQDYEVNFQPIPFAILAVIAIALIPIQTSTEEYVFRGYLMQGFALLARNKWFPLLMTSFIFGGMHYFNPEVAKMGNIIMIYYIGTGLFLGTITLMDDGMELALGFHAANNLTAALLITSDWTVFQTHSILKDNSEPTAGFDVLFPVLIIFPILLFIFSKKYNWNNWKERLTGTIRYEDILSNEISDLGKNEE